MVQAARSGVQNIAEGSQASGASRKSEMKLTSVARASLEELRLDYEDFLRQRNLPLWPRSDPRRQALIDLRPATADDVADWSKQTRAQAQSKSSTKSTPSTKSSTSTSSPPTYAELAANAALALIAVACALLDRQLASQARAFENEGGFTERLYWTRTQARTRERKGEPH
jgi:four helix bundle suffix protein